jgi:hypothetical protein
VNKFQLKSKLINIANFFDILLQKFHAIFTVLDVDLLLQEAFQLAINYSNLEKCAIPKIAATANSL